MGAAGMLNVGNLNLRDIILSTEATQTTRFIINSAEQNKTTPSVCDETADTNRPRYSYRLYNLDSSRFRGSKI